MFEQWGWAGIVGWLVGVYISLYINIHKKNVVHIKTTKLVRALKYCKCSPPHDPGWLGTRPVSPKAGASWGKLQTYLFSRGWVGTNLAKELSKHRKLSTRIDS